jgi:hypothetical protein
LATAANDPAVPWIFEFVSTLRTPLAESPTPAAETPFGRGSVNVVGEPRAFADNATFSIAVFD